MEYIEQLITSRIKNMPSYVSIPEFRIVVHAADHGDRTPIRKSKKRPKYGKIHTHVEWHTSAGETHPVGTVSVWVRDVNEEGIEPHPGPRYLSKNINSIQGKGKLFQALRAIRRESDRDPITATFIQDHRLPPTRRREIASTAAGQNLLVLTAHAPPHAHNGVHYGGTMIVIPYEAIERNKDESITDACLRITATSKSRSRGRMITAKMRVDGTDLDLTAAYAPADPQERPSFLTRLGRTLTTRTVLGIDANCVPDVNIDLKRDATSPYPNQGADILRDAIDAKGLSDVARETIGTEPYFTAHHIVQGGACWSRIDQLYAPPNPSIQWSHETPNDFFPERPGAEIDHRMIEIRSKRVRPKRGKDLDHINESIFDDLNFVTSLHDKIITLLLHINRAKADGWRTGWETIKSEAKKMCVHETARRRYIEGRQIANKRKLLSRDPGGVGPVHTVS